MKARCERRSRAMWTGMVHTVGSVVLLLVLLPGCGERAPRPGERSFTIGVHQFMHHPLLDEAARGLRDELASAGLSAEHGHQVIFKNANGETSVAVQISQQFVDRQVDLIVALGTPAAQSACRVTTTIPIVFGVITDPVLAGIADSIERPGGNKTGTSDRWPFEKQVALIRQIVPEAQRVGIVLNPAESNTQASMSYIRPALQQEGLQAIEVPVANTAEVYGAAMSLVGRCDVLLIPGDNTVIAAVDTLVKVARENRIPLIGGSEDLVRRGSIATYAGDYYQIGRTTGRIVTQILQEGEQPGMIPVSFAEEQYLIVNEEAAVQQGVSLPPSLVANAKRI